MTINFSWCKDAFTWWPTSTGVTAHASFPLFLNGCITSASFMALLAYLWLQKRRGMRGEQHGSSTGSSPLIFPLYVRVLWCGLFATVFDTSVSLFVAGTTGLGADWKGLNSDGVSEHDTVLPSLLFGVTWGMYHFVFEGVALLMLNPGVGSVAARKTATLAGIWALVTCVTCGLSRYNEGHLANVVMTAICK